MFPAPGLKTLKQVIPSLPSQDWFLPPDKSSFVIEPGIIPTGEDAPVNLG